MDLLTGRNITAHHQIVAAVIRRGTDVLLVQQQGRGDPAPNWALPGGRVEPGESLIEALVRGVQEETGLRVETPDRLVYVAQIENPDSSVRSDGEIPRPGDTSAAFVFEVTAFEGDLLPADPDDIILAVEFVSRHEAVERLERLPWRVMREPIVQALRGEVPAGALWLYRREGGGDALVARIPELRGVQTSPGTASSVPDPRTEREKGFIVLGCLVVVAFMVFIVIAGIIATAHPHIF